MALLNAIAKAFGQYSNLKHYLTTCFTLILKRDIVEKPKCFIRLNICHYIHMVSRWKFFSKLNPAVKKFYIRAMALLTKQTNFDRFVELVRCILIISLSEEIGKDNDGNNSPAARIIITHHIKGIKDVLLENKDENDKNKDDKDVENKELDIEIKDCNVGS